MLTPTHLNLGKKKRKQRGAHVTTSLMRRRKRQTVTAHILFICLLFPLPRLGPILHPTYLSAGNVEVFCQHKGRPLTGPIVHLKSFGRETAAAAAAAEQAPCALNAEAPFKGAASRLALTAGNKLGRAPN